METVKLNSGEMIDTIKVEVSVLGKGSLGSDEIAFTLLKVDLEEVSFSGTKYHELKSDDVSKTYSAPHWVDNPPPSTRQWLSDSKAHLPESAPSLRSLSPASGKVKPPSFLLTAKTQSGGRIRNDGDEDDLPM